MSLLSVVERGLRVGQKVLPSVDELHDAVCLELKSLKLYLWSFRNDGIFYERVVNRILDDLVAVAKPRMMRIVGDFNVRGGLKSVITAEYRKP